MHILLVISHSCLVKICSQNVYIQDSMNIRNSFIFPYGRDVVSAMFEFDPFLTVCCEDFGAKTIRLSRER